MRSRIIAALAAVCLVAVGVGAALLNGGSEEYERYHQHREAQQLSDLSAEDQEAACSSNIDTESFASHLPVVSIDTRGQEVPGEQLRVDAEGLELPYERSYTMASDGAKTIPTDFSLFYDETSANRLDDTPALETQAEVRYRGHSSRLFDKRSYAVTFTESDRTTKRDLDVLNMGKESDWILNGPFLDKTQIRNYLSMNVIGQFMQYVPDVRFCELFVNGEYQGIYLLMETVKYGEDRVSLTPSDSRTSATSYIVQRDWGQADNPSNITDLFDETYVVSGTYLDLIYPNEMSVTIDQREWIASDLNSIEKSLYSYDYDTENHGYWTVLDVDSFVDYAIVNELTLNIDAGSYSTFYYRDVRGKLAIGPVWDFNNAYDNYTEESVAELGFLMNEKPFYYMLFKDEKFVGQVISRYRELRSSYLSDEALSSYIDEVVAYLGPAIDRNFQVWGYTFDASALGADSKLSPEDRNPESYDEAVDDLKDAIELRGEWLDRNIENLRQYSHESAVKMFNH